MSKPHHLPAMASSTIRPPATSPQRKAIRVLIPLGLMVCLCLLPFLSLAGRQHLFRGSSTVPGWADINVPVLPQQYERQALNLGDNGFISRGLTTRKRELADLHRQSITVDNPAWRNVTEARDTDPLMVYVDWPHSFESFGLLNYRSLESLLTWHPRARVRVLLVAPNPAKHYRYADALPITIFDKYAKRGYDVDFEVVTGDTRVRGQHPGSIYFQEVFQPGLQEAFNKSSFDAPRRAPIGAALRHFLLLWSLYHNGGVSFDLNTLLLRPLPSGRYWHGSGASPACVAHFEEPRTAAGPYLLSLRAQDPILACVLSRFDDRGDGLHVCMDQSPVGGSDCIIAALDECGAALPPVRSLKTHRPVEWFDCSYRQAWTNYNDPDQGLVLYQTLLQRPEVSAVWMGVVSTSGRWKAPAPSSLLGLLLSKHVYLDTWHPLQVNPRCAITCPRYANAPDANTSLVTQTKASLTELERQAAQYVCAPSIVVPGAYKAASSTLFANIAKHPQVLRPLVGSNFKETGLYLGLPGRDRLRDRVRGFPFIDQHESFATIDATVFYLNSHDSPYQIQADSPNVRAVMSLREPVSRTLSQYRYSYNRSKKDWQSMHQAALQAIPIMQQCFDTHLATVDMQQIRREGRGVWLSQELDRCLLPLRAYTVQAAIEASLYLPQVMRWMEVLGSERVLLVTAEEMAQQPKALFDRTLAFLGLCGFDFTYTAENVRGMQWPEGVGVDEKTLSNLRTAFIPWNAKLIDYLGHPLPWPA